MRGDWKDWTRGTCAGLSQPASLACDLCVDERRCHREDEHLSRRASWGFQAWSTVEGNEDWLECGTPGGCREGQGAELSGHQEERAESKRTSERGGGEERARKFNDGVAAPGEVHRKWV